MSNVFLFSLQLWLFGYELADTLCVFCANEIHILSSKKKIDFIKPLEEVLSSRPELPKLKLYTRNKVSQKLTKIEITTVTIAPAIVSVIPPFGHKRMKRSYFKNLLF